jgi:Zn-dependent M28 family amino/carboxypeptidase
MAEAAAAGAAAMRLPWVPLARGELTASDHACFLEAGIPGFLASTPEILSHPHYHTVRDLPATVPAANLEAAARTFWASVRGLVQAEVTPPAALGPTAAPGRELPSPGARRDRAARDVP